MHVSITMKPVAIIEAEGIELNKENGRTATKQPEVSACIENFKLALPKINSFSNEKNIHPANETLT